MYRFFCLSNMMKSHTLLCSEKFSTNEITCIKLACTYVSGDAVLPRKGRTHGLKIFQRFHFSSALKRMSVIAGHSKAGSSDTEYMATVKGAPETLRNMVGYGLNNAF